MRCLFAVCVCFFWFGCSRPIPPAADRDAIASAVAEFHKSLRGGDQDTVLRLLARDAQILENGVRETLEEYRDGHLGSDIAFAKGVPSNRSALLIRQEGDVAWVTSTSRAQGRMLGRDVDSTGTELMVLHKTPEGWRIRAIHWSSKADQSAGH